MATTKTKAKPRAVKKAVSKTGLTADEYRKLLGDSTFEKREIKIPLTTSDTTGSIDQVNARLRKKVASSSIVGDWTIKTERGRQRYNYNTHRYEYEGGNVIVGYAPYTDEEIIKKGPALLAAKLKAEARAVKTRAADLQRFKALATKLGYELVGDDDA